MVARKEQASQQPKASNHPLLRNIGKLDDQIGRMQARKDAQEFKIEQVEEWQRIVSSLAGTEHGQHFLKAMVEHSGLFAPDNGSAQVMIERRMHSAFYLKWVRPFVPKQQLSIIE